MGIDLDVDGQCGTTALLWRFDLDFYWGLTIRRTRGDDAVEVSESSFEDTGLACTWLEVV